MCFRSRVNKVIILHTPSHLLAFVFLESYLDSCQALGLTVVSLAPFYSLPGTQLKSSNFQRMGRAYSDLPLHTEGGPEQLEDFKRFWTSVVVQSASQPSCHFVLLDRKVSFGLLPLKWPQTGPHFVVETKTEAGFP